MKTKKLSAFPVLPELGRWMDIQKHHQHIVRWGAYGVNNPELFSQSNLHHISSTVSLMVFYITKLFPYAPYMDPMLLLMANILHEDGEMLLRKDVLFDQKTDACDHAEFKTFFKSIGSDPSDPRLQPFLLQFVTKSEIVMTWDDPAPSIMMELIKHYQYEGKVFNALERMDYLYYALGFGYQTAGDVVITNHVLRNQVPKLDEYAQSIRGFAKEVWTPELSVWSHQFMENFRDMPGSKSDDEIRRAYEWARAHGHMPRSGSKKVA